MVSDAVVTPDHDHEVAPERGEVVCKMCAKHIARAEAILADLKRTEVALRAERGKSARIQAELDEKNRTDPKAAQALEVFDFWKAHCRPRAREFTGDRLKNTLARLKAGYTVKQLKLAVWGAAVDAFEKDGRRYDDLALIMRDPAKTDSFMERGWIAVRAGVLPESSTDRAPARDACPQNDESPAAEAGGGGAPKSSVRARDESPSCVGKEEQMLDDDAAVVVPLFASTDAA